MSKYDKLKLKVASQVPNVLSRLTSGSCFDDARVTLEDLLLLSKDIEIEMGCRAVRVYKENDKKNMVFWRLGVPLKKQSKETINFFNKII